MQMGDGKQYSPIFGKDGPDLGSESDICDSDDDYKPPGEFVADLHIKEDVDFDYFFIRFC